MPSSRRSHGDNIASMAWGARNLIPHRSVGVRTLRTHERDMARRTGQTILDPQNDGLCACTAKGDGRHYVDTDPRTLGRLADLVVSYRLKPDGRIVFVNR